jgi:hypothetical protein
MARYGALPPTISSQLEEVEPSVGGSLKYYPCAARLANGDALTCVYVAWDEAYIRVWGIYPEQDRGKNWVHIEDVREIVDSPSRLPAKFATELYKHGESGMGYTIFTVVFSDGSRQAYVTGNAVDFIRYPEGMGPADVARVIPHEGREAATIEAPQYHWCLYSK